jgi:hypothetical protein
MGQAGAERIRNNFKLDDQLHKLYQVLENAKT